MGSGVRQPRPACISAGWGLAWVGSLYSTKCSCSTAVAACSVCCSSWMFSGQLQLLHRVFLPSSFSTLFFFFSLCPLCLWIDTACIFIAVPFPWSPPLSGIVHPHPQHVAAESPILGRVILLDEWLFCASYTREWHCWSLLLNLHKNSPSSGWIGTVCH